MDRRALVRWAAGAALLALVVYATSLQNGLVLDDADAIVENAATRDPLAWKRLLLASSWVASDRPTTSYRPLTTWTFAVNRAVHGERPFGYHLVNVLGHAGVAALVVWFGGTLGLPATTAGLAGVLFAVHPVNSEAVAAVVGRAEVLSAGLALLALIAWRRAASLPARTCGLAAYALALLAKEYAIALVVLLPLGDLLFADEGSPGLFLRRLRGTRGLSYVALAAVTAGYLALRTAALGDVIGARGMGPGQIPFWLNPVASAPTTTRVLTALEVLALALWRLVAPFRLSAAYYYRYVPVVSSPAEPGAALGLIVAAGLVGLAVVLWRRRVAFFCLALALATYGVVSNLVVPIGTLFGERFLYLPSVGFCTLVAMTRWPRVAAAILVVVWGVRTGLRNRVWHDDLTLAESMVASAPDSAHAHAYLGTTYALLGRHADAVRELERALAIYPDHVEALYNAGTLYMQDGRTAEALDLLSRATTLDPSRFGAWINRAMLHSEERDFPAALAAADRAIALRPEVPNGYVMRGFALLGLGKFTDARVAFEKALGLPHAAPDALLGFGEAALGEGNLVIAGRALERLVGISPTADAYHALLETYRRAGRDADAARVTAEAHTRYPDDPLFW